MCSFLVFIGVMNLIFINCQGQTIYGRPSNGVQIRNGIINFSNNNSAGYNKPYIEKPENILLIPSINQNEEHKHKKYYKKSPKRTIQKIIKKNRTRKKFNVHQVSSSTTLPMKVDDVYGQDDQTWNYDSATGQPNQRKKPRKYNLKVARYPTYKYPGKKEYRRMKREEENRDDVYILKEFDEMEFLKTDGDYNVVKSKVQKYW